MCFTGQIEVIYSKLNHVSDHSVLNDANLSFEMKLVNGFGLTREDVGELVNSTYFSYLGQVFVEKYYLGV